MKDLKYFAIAGSFVSMLALGVTSCTDANDWDVDSSYDRVFSVQQDKISVSEEATSAEVSWTKVKGAENYIIELSTDSLYDEIEIGQNGAMVFGLEELITESPYVVNGLVPDTKYFLRIKAAAESKNDSKWSYLSDYSFTTKTEQIFESITGNDLKAESVTLHWEAGADVERIDITDNNATLVVSYPLSDNEKAEGTATISGLTPLTSYVATLYLGETKRGVLEFTTTAKVPDADFTYNLAAGESLDNDLITNLYEQGYESINITLESGAEYSYDETLVIPDGMSVTFFGLPGEQKAVIKLGLLDLAGTHAYVNFENVELTGKQYLVNQSTECAVEEMKFSNCFIYGFSYTPIRMQKSGNKMIKYLSFENSIIYGATSSNYSLVNVKTDDQQGKVDNISFRNSTIVCTGKGFVTSEKTNFTSLLIENCTLSKVVANSAYLLDCSSDSYGPSEGVIIKNTILGSTFADSAKGIRASGNIVVENSYQTKDVHFTSNKFSGLTDYEGTETQLFKDPANFDFTIIDNSFAGKDNCGDPRWYIK